ncbi:terpenoid synthase [Wolfiporia cocos MD-104 SS10]|uniref:Terpenoid synthase n=1 Tax=Wolfiporia cocos (strain MD-104) TaxID=742152 RepID=A0A2H3JBI6_WOLCO|nr:terpenoid synthase [Wolfiporia cocos MD-104 SS10]
MGFHYLESGVIWDRALEFQVQSITRSWDNDAFLRPFISTAITGTVTAYGHISSLETKAQIAIFTTFVLAMDDPDIFKSLACRDFPRRMCTGSIQLEDGLLREFARVLENMWNHYTDFAANTIYSSGLRFINGCILENDHPDSAAGRNTLPFVEYKRIMSATAEAYTCFIWDKTTFPNVTEYMKAIPDTMLFVSYVNDIMSFYKEELAGEANNYIHERATITGGSVSETLYRVIDDTVVAVERVRRILGEGAARAAWESFATGYITVHIENPRYRLGEILRF